ncbi:MAG: nucleotidyltransferase family protein [Acidobacteria bacterium]|nr:nucleotidyltransferase family protein [Acidobacteriota bacterium]
MTRPVSGPVVGPPERCAAVILAAGGSSRFGPGAKQLAQLGGRALVEIAVAAALDAEVFSAVAVVVGAVALDGVLPPSVVAVDNPDWRAGQATSLQAGVDWARSVGADQIVVGLADQPGVTAEAWRRVATASATEPILVATYEGRRGNPVRLDASVWDLLPVDGDEGARTLIRRRPELVGAVPCPGTMLDIDTPEDLERWN